MTSTRSRVLIHRSSRFINKEYTIGRATARGRFDADYRGLYNLRDAKTGVIIIAKVLLTTTVEQLGYVGEVVDVADGYARNYLIPRGFAVAPTEHNVARYAKQKEAHEAELMKREEKARHLRDKLADKTLEFVRKAHDNDKLYGSVRVEDIAAEIERLVGTSIETSRIHLEHPIETLGAHSVTVSLYRDIRVEVRIQVNEEGQEGE
jgi:large subunit ribosomal protein L9